MNIELTLIILNITWFLWRLLLYYSDSQVKIRIGFNIGVRVKARINIRVTVKNRDSVGLWT